MSSIDERRERASAGVALNADTDGWYGNDQTPQYLFPFAAAFGGVAQFAAGMWAYRARDAIATAMHGTWGAFWMGYGLLWLLVATGDLATGSVMDQAVGFWFFALAGITAFGALAALFENAALTTVLTLLAIGAACLGIGEYTGINTWEQIGGWVLVGSAIAAAYTAGAMMLEGAAGRVVLPLGKYVREANIPGREVTIPIELEHGEVGVRHGQ